MVGPEVVAGLGAAVVVRGQVGAGGGGANAAASHNGPQSYEGPPLFLRWHTASPVLDVFCSTHPEHCASPAAVQASQHPAAVLTPRRVFVAWPRIPVPDGSLFQLHESVSEADAAPQRRSTARERSIMAKRAMET